MITPTVFAKHHTIALVHINIIVKYYANNLHNKPRYASCKSPSSDICYKCLCLAKWPCFHTTYTYASVVLQKPFFQDIQQLYQQGQHQQKHQHQKDRSNQMYFSATPSSKQSNTSLGWLTYVVQMVLPVGRLADH